MKKYRLALVLVSSLVLIILVWSFTGSNETNQDITAKAFKGKFEDLVSSSGELIAKNSEDIAGPRGMQRYGLYNVKIQDLVAEGSYVEAGDYVCSLDRSDISTRINDVQIELDKAMSQFTQTKLDTALTLREKRNELENYIFQLKQKEIELRQSEFEPPATIEKIKIDLQKQKDDLVRAKENYIINKQQSIAKMGEATAELQQKKNRLTKLLDLEKEFTIMAPKAGMVIYKRNWDGTKKKAGSRISPWNPAVATLPDLSSMLSITYINEVDVRKIKEGQAVKLGLDAFPKAELTGTITKVANVGENRKENDSKVFEVEIEVNESDSTYRPGMTTSNNIITHVLEDALQIPIEAVYNQDGLSFVYLKNSVGTSKREIKLGRSNEEFVIVLDGLEEGAEVYLTEPESAKESEVKKLTASIQH